MQSVAWWWKPRHPRLIMPDADFLFEIKIIALNPPAQFGYAHKRVKSMSSGRVENQYLVLFSLRHSIRSHSSALRGQIVVAMADDATRAKRETAARSASRQVIVSQSDSANPAQALYNKPMLFIARMSLPAIAAEGFCAGPSPCFQPMSAAGCLRRSSVPTLHALAQRRVTP